jgi:hypothetical protein
MRHLTASALPLILLACSGGDPANSQTSTAPRPFKVSIIGNFDSPWAMTFLPDGRMLVTEKAGELILFDPKNGTKIPIDGIPKVDDAGQGALMDVVLGPEYAADKTVYFSFSEAGSSGRESGKKGVALATGTFAQAADGTTRLDNVRIIFRGTPKVEGDGHYSGRIAFSPDGKYLFFTNGERQKFSPAQDPESTLGKVLRLNLDGTPPTAIRWRPRASTRRSGPTATATCWASPSTRTGVCGSRRWARAAATRSISSSRASITAGPMHRTAPIMTAATFPTIRKATAMKPPRSGGTRRSRPPDCSIIPARCFRSGADR